MKKTIFLLMMIIPVITMAQQKLALPIHPSDHFLFQLSSDHWLGAPDSINDHTKGSSRGANLYVMIDRPFASNKHFSVAFGLGVGTSHIFFNNMGVDIAGNISTLKFNNLENAGRFKKYKVSTAYLEIPVEMRFSSNPGNPKKSFKIALGAKAGTLLNAHTKGKTVLDAAGNTVSNSTQKISSRTYFNSTRLSATGRIGYGNFCLFGSYGLGPVFKDGVAADMKLIQMGITFSAL